MRNVIIFMDDIITRGIFMIFRFNWERMPLVAKTYVVIRRTIWQVTDPFHILLYVQDGRCLLETGGQKYTLKAGDLFFLPENTMYARRPLDDSLCTLFYIHFKMPGMISFSDQQAQEDAVKWKKQMDNALLQDQFMGLMPGQVYIAPLTHLQAYRDEIEDMISASINTDDRQNMQHAMLSSVMVSKLMLMASSEVLKALLEGDTMLPADQTPEKLRQAILFIHQHESEKISLTDLCNACAVSKQQMIRHFKANLHTTPTEYITHYKINKAKELFARGPELSVKEVAGELGYEDQCYFSRVFTRVTGETPTAFRARALGFDELDHIARTRSGPKNRQEEGQ